MDASLRFVLIAPQRLASCNRRRLIYQALIVGGRQNLCGFEARRHAQDADGLAQPLVDGVTTDAQPDRLLLAVVVLMDKAKAFALRLCEPVYVVGRRLDVGGHAHLGEGGAWAKLKVARSKGATHGERVNGE